MRGFELAHTAHKVFIFACPTFLTKQIPIANSIEC
jgi:hypothetical protein